MDNEKGDGLFEEGCGKEGPIKSIFISEFHPKVGPKIMLQYPPEAISKELFDAVSTYIIPKTHLCRLTMSVNTLGSKIIGYPIQIKNEKYERNAFYFNTCFVCDSWARTVQYEQVLIKLSEFFYNLELEKEFLSKIQDEKEIVDILESVLVGLNGLDRECSIVIRDRLLKLKVVLAVLEDPLPVKSHQVPVFIVDVHPIDKWDLTTKQLIPYVDGFNHVSKIAHLADVDTNLVKACLQNLLYYKVIKLVPIFQYGNIYMNTSIIHSKLIKGDPSFKAECLYFVSRMDLNLPHFADVVRFYFAMKRGVTIKELCGRFRSLKASPTTRIGLAEVHYGSTHRYSDQSLSSSTHSRASSIPTTPVKPRVPFQISAALSANASKVHQTQEFQSILSVIDERRLVLFGLVHGLIAKVEKYPLIMGNKSGGGGSLYNSNTIMGMNNNQENERLMKHRQKHTSLYTMFDGIHSYDEICLNENLTQNQLDELVDMDPEVVTIWKF